MNKEMEVFMVVLKREEGVSDKGRRGKKVKGISDISYISWVIKDKKVI